jgi:hypothetical protein
MKKMRKTNVIKKLVNCGLITLVGFSLFIGCEIPYYPVDEYGEYSNGNEYYDISFQVGLPLDNNGYYHLTLSREHWQTLHKVSGVITDDYDNFVDGFWLEWESNLYWYLGDTLGYIKTQYLNDDAMYVTVNTSYIIGFNGHEVPTSNLVSYSNGYGQFNNMIAPVQSMIGDTLTLTANWSGGQRSFSIVLD